MQYVSIYTDGSSRGNPGPGGYGALLRYEDSSGKRHEKRLSAGYRQTTNNRMELMGVIAALEALKHPCDITVFTDSQYIANAFNQHWIDSWKAKGWKTASKKPVKNIDLWKRLLALLDSHSYRFEWVKGHAGHEENEICDTLATTAADSDDLMEDKGYTEDAE